MPRYTDSYARCRETAAAMTTVQRVEADGAAIEYTLRRSKRRKKTVQISVSGGKVEVSAPLRTPNREIQAIVQKRSGWILDKLAADAQAPPPLRLVTGDTLPYLGRELPLVVERADVHKPSVLSDGARLLVGVPAGLPQDERREAVRTALVAWYRARAAELLADSVARWLPVMSRNRPPRPERINCNPRVLVREQKTRWGSCSSDGTLRFSWRLAMVEQELIDSVAVHELAHLEVMNHSPAFWDVVLRAMPDAKARRKRLSEAGRRLPL